MQDQSRAEHAAVGAAVKRGLNRAILPAWSVRGREVTGAGHIQHRTDYNPRPLRIYAGSGRSRWTRGRASREREGIELAGFTQFG